MTETNLPKKTIETASIQTTPPIKKKKKRTGLKFFVFLSVFLALVGTGVYFYWQYTENKASEERAFAALQESTSSADCCAFLARYPNSKYAFEVERRLKQFEAMESEWRRIARSSNPTDFVNFKNKYNNAYYDRLIDLKINSLDWSIALRDNTPEAFRRYMMLHPQGDYYAEASIANEQAEKQSVTPEESFNVYHAVRSFFDGFGNIDENLLTVTTAPVMTRFLNKDNVTQNELLGIIRHMYGSTILNSSFNFPNNYPITKEGSGIAKRFKAGFTTKQLISRTDNGKTHGLYGVQVELDEHYKITSLIMSKIENQNQTE